MRKLRRTLVVTGVVAGLVTAGTAAGIAVASAGQPTRSTAAAVSQVARPTASTGAKTGAPEEDTASSSQQLTSQGSPAGTTATRPGTTAPSSRPGTTGTAPKPEKLSPPNPTRSASPPPAPKANCSPAPTPKRPIVKTDDAMMVNPYIPFNGLAVISVCTTAGLGGHKPTVLTYNQGAKLTSVLGELKPATKPNELCTKEMRGYFQIYIEYGSSKRLPRVYNGEAHGCGYVTYVQGGQTYYGGKDLGSLIRSLLAP